MANQMIKTGGFTLAGVLLGALGGAWVDWHAYLGNPTRPNLLSDKRSVNFDVEAFGQASLVVHPNDTIELTQNGNSDPNLHMNFAGDDTPCANNTNHQAKCPVSNPGNLQKFYVFDCTDSIATEPYNCPDPGIKQTGTGGDGKDLTDFFVALKVDLLCIHGCDLEKILGGQPLSFPPLVATALSPPHPKKEAKISAVKNLKPMIAAAPATANSYAYVYCKSKISTIRPMNPPGQDSDIAKVSAGQVFTWVSNDPISVTSINPSGLCTSSPVKVQYNSGIYVGSCSVSNSAVVGTQYSYQMQDDHCAQTPSVAGTIVIVD